MDFDQTKKIEVEVSENVIAERAAQAHGTAPGSGSPRRRVAPRGARSVRLARVPLCGAVRRHGGGEHGLRDRQHSGFRALMRFGIHPLFFALALLLVLFGQAQAFLWTLAAVALHEAGHALAARMRGYVVRELTLYPFGAAMGMGEEMDPVSNVVVGLAGPLANLLGAALLIALWWLFPATYLFTHPFLYANLGIALFNLLPVYPLDGSRVVRGLARNRMKAVRGMQAAGVALSLLLFALFVVSFALGAVSFTLGVTAVFLFAGAAWGGRADAYVGVLAARSKNFLAGVRERCVEVSREAPLIRLFHHIDGRSVTTFRVMEGDPPREVARWTEGEPPSLPAGSSPARWGSALKGEGRAERPKAEKSRPRRRTDTPARTGAERRAPARPARVVDISYFLN